MKSYLVKTPKLVQRIFPKRVWAFPSKNNHVFLTFDDGPISDVTPWVVSLLKKHNAKATFFCIGDNVRKHPEIFKYLIAEGHSVGNHTYHHLNGSRTSLQEYVDNVVRAEVVMEETGRKSKEEREKRKKEEPKLDKTKAPVTDHQSLFTRLFRPPYGRLNSKQAQALYDQGYNIIMWDVLSADFDQDISEEKCLQNVLKNIKAGSIVVFHDSLKAEKNLRYALPKVLEYIKNQGWECHSIPTN